jgi:hypothetical protein
VAERGWYPDPGGAPGRYRYWDGVGWSAETTADPRSPAPGSQPPSGRPAAQRSGGAGRGPLLIIALVVVLIIAAVGVLVVRSQRSGALVDPDPPAPSVSGWDDSRPLPTAGPSKSPTPPPTTQPSTSAGSPSAASVDCPRGNPLQRRPHPHDDRVHGGRLSFAVPSGQWRRRPNLGAGLSFAHDVELIDQPVEVKWVASLSVGALSRADGFVDPQRSAEQIMQCIGTSAYYRHITGRRQLESEPISLAGHGGWRIRGEIRVADQEVEAEGDVLELRVVDTGEAGSLSFFWGCAPIGDSTRIRNLDATVRTLGVD